MFVCWGGGDCLGLVGVFLFSFLGRSLCISVWLVWVFVYLFAGYFIQPVLHNIVIRSLQRGSEMYTVVRAFAHGAMGRRIYPSWGGPIELFLVPASDPRLV